MPFVILVADDHIDDEGYEIYELPAMLRAAGYEVIVTSDGENVYDLVEESTPDLIVLDIVFENQGVNGIEILESIRLNSDTIPVILITSYLAETEDVLRGFEVGADDYVTYPRDNREVLARIRANLPPEVMVIDDYIEIDFANRMVRIKREGNWEKEHFQRLQFELLKVLVVNANTIVLSPTLKERVWGKLIGDGTLFTAICKIRAKLEPDPKQPIYIEAIKYLGYRFNGKPVSAGLASVRARSRCCRE